MTEMEDGTSDNGLERFGYSGITSSLAALFLRGHDHGASLKLKFETSRSWNNCNLPPFYLDEVAKLGLAGRRRETWTCFGVQICSRDTKQSSVHERSTAFNTHCSPGHRGLPSLPTLTFDARGCGNAFCTYVLLMICYTTSRWTAKADGPA